MEVIESNLFFFKFNNFSVKHFIEKVTLPLEFSIEFPMVWSKRAQELVYNIVPEVGEGVCK